MFAHVGTHTRHSGVHGKLIWCEDFVNLCIDVLPCEVELCKKMLEVLVRSRGVCALSLDAEDTKSASDVVSQFLEKHPDNAGVIKIQSKLATYTKNGASPHRKRRADNHSPWTPVNGDADGRIIEDFSPHHTDLGSSTSSKALAAVSETMSVDISKNGDTHLTLGVGEHHHPHREAFKKPRLTFLPEASLDWRCRIFVAMDDASKSMLGKFIAFVLILTIAVSTVSFILESLPRFKHTPDDCAKRKAAGLALTIKACEPIPDDSFWFVEAICIGIFTIDYVIRLCTVHATTPSNGVVRTLRHIKEPLNIIDFLAVLPFYVDLCMTDGSLGVVRILRLARILRPFKMAKHHPGFRMFAEVMRLSGEPLLLLLFFNGIFIVLLGSLMFFAESEMYSVDAKFTANGTYPSLHPLGVYVRQDKQHEHYEVTPFKSIPYGFWFVCVTMTTVGYGDYTPNTGTGKVLGVVIFYIGILFLAMPIGILSSNFEAVYQDYCKKVNKEDPRRKKMFKTSNTIRDMNEAGSDSWFPSEGDLRSNVFLIFHDPRASRLSTFVQYFVTATIFVSILTFIIETLPEFRHTPSACDPTHLSVDTCEPEPDEIFYTIEVVCVVIFTIDYALRAGLVHSARPEQVSLDNKVVRGRCPRLNLTARYCLQTMNLVDFFAVAPFYFEMVMGENKDLAVVKILRLVRLFRLLKSPKLRLCADMFVNVLSDAMPALLTLFFMTTLMCVLFASCMVFAETSEYSVEDFTDRYPTGVYIRPKTGGNGIEPSPFTSIPYAFWWFFVTSTTVGYGDDYPTTTGGRIIAIANFYLGIVLLALPLTIVGQSFNKFYPQWVAQFVKKGSMTQMLESPKGRMLRLKASTVDILEGGLEGGVEGGVEDKIEGGHEDEVQGVPATRLPEKELVNYDTLRKVALEPADGLLIMEDIDDGLDDLPDLHVAEEPVIAIAKVYSPSKNTEFMTAKTAWD